MRADFGYLAGMKHLGQKLAPFAIVGIVAACNAVAWNVERAGTRSFALWSMLPTLVLADAGLEKFGGDSVAETARNARAYLEHLAIR